MYSGRLRIGVLWFGLIMGNIFAVWSSDASAHWNRNFNKDGHYYWAAFATQYELDPQITANEGAANNGHTVCTVLVDETFFRGPNWMYQAYPPGFDCGTVWDFYFPHGDGNENHCQVGFTWDITLQVCLAGGKCLAYDGEIVNYVAVSAGEPFANVDNDLLGHACLFDLQTSSANGGCFDLSYKNTAWEASDHDEWSNLNDSAGSEEIGTTINGAPATCPGESDPVWPGGTGGGGGGGGDPEPSCLAGFEKVTGWPEAGGAGSTADTICLDTGCNADIVGITVCAAGTCVGDIVLTGNVCDLLEDTFEGSDADPGGGPGTGSGAVVSILEKIHGRQTAAMVAQGVGDAANVAAVIAAGAGIETAISDNAPECQDSSCTGDVQALGAVGDTETTTQGFLDRVEAAPIVAAIAGIGTSFPAGVCPTPDSDPIAFLDGAVLTLDAHCGLWDTVAPILQAVMVGFFALTGGLIILRA